MLLPESTPERAATRDARGQALTALADLVEVLCGPEGCPWDQEQTVASVSRYLTEEVEELAEAIHSGDAAHIGEEWGDAFFVALFLGHVAEQDGTFDMATAIRGIIDKLVRRHPHVFASVDVDGTEGVVRKWAEIKAAEKMMSQRSGVLDRVPPQVSALRKANRLQEAAATVGFDWPDMRGVWDKVDEEVAELREARASGDLAALAHEIGDLQFSLVNVQRHLGLQAEQPLNQTCNRFTERFRVVEALAAERGMTIADASLEVLDALWDEAKAREDRNR